jgi:hypothetical protein
MPIVEKFARVKLGTEFEKIKDEDREVLKRLIQAAAFLNPVYLRQVSQFNPQFKQEIEDTHNKRLIESFMIMGGPWDRFEGDKPFYGSINKPLGAGFYPADMTREAFETWIDEHPEDKEAFLSFTTLIRRRENKLVARPYSEAYALELNKAYALLKEAAELTSNASLKKYLNARAESLLSNDYVDSDGDWIALDSDIELVFGPYETYEDQLFGYKATFEAFVGYRNADETRRLEHIASLVEEMQAALPISAEMKDTRGEQPSSPFVVIDLLSTAGEARIGIQTLAFVLPNDPVVVQKYGTKKVMMKNVQEAKFNAILKPIAERFLTADALKKISFEAFFRHTILHETGHSLGPKAVKDSNESIIHHLADVYAPIEECKADSTSNFISHWLFGRGELTEVDMEATYATMVAGFFRSLRFGLTQAHARANAIQLNFLREKGAVTCDDAGKFDFVMDKMPDAVTELVRTVMEMEYAGDRDAARAFLDKYAVLSDDLTARLHALSDLPIDILCEYEAEKLLV